ncbi:MAG: hypothetical protein HKN31_02880, partial [Pricia sp.]|nr:hypothetical protein [Pricia sp.]
METVKKIWTSVMNGTQKCSMVLVLVLTINSCSKSDSDPVIDDPEVEAPNITAIEPTSGMAGAEVTFTGTNFGSTASANTVTFNGVTATVNSASATQLIAVVPANATTGVVAVTVNGQKGQGPSFTVLPSGNAYDCSKNEITENTVWEDIDPGNAIDYIITCAISVKGNALLTIEPGVIIAFEGEESGIFASEGGGIKAIGTVT